MPSAQLHAARTFAVEATTETISWFLLPKGPSVVTKLFPKKWPRNSSNTALETYEKQIQAFRQYVYPRLLSNWGSSTSNPPPAWVVRWLSPQSFADTRWPAGWGIDNGSSPLIITIPITALSPPSHQLHGSEFCWTLHRLLIYKILARFLQSRSFTPFANPKYRETFATLWQAWVLCIAHLTAPIPQPLSVSPIGWRAAFLLQLTKEDPKLLEKIHERLLITQGSRHLYTNPEALFSGLLGPISLASLWKTFLAEQLERTHSYRKTTVLLG